jgi:phenylalanyl-tRNA synthetase beta chain
VQQYSLQNAPVVFELDVAALTQVDKLSAGAVSKFQAVRRDLALLMDEAVTVAQLQTAFASAKQAIVAGIEVFDVYRGKGLPEGKKSLAFKVLLQDTHKTLTDEEVDAAVAALIKKAETCGAILRT